MHNGGGVGVVDGDGTLLVINAAGLYRGTWSTTGVFTDRSTGSSCTGGPAAYDKKRQNKTNSSVLKLTSHCVILVAKRESRGKFSLLLLPLPLLLLYSTWNFKVINIPQHLIHVRTALTK